MEGRGSVWHTQKNTMRQNVGQLGISLRRLRLWVLLEKGVMSWGAGASVGEVILGKSNKVLEALVE